jgi:hypothetical protein
LWGGAGVALSSNPGLEGGTALRLKMLADLPFAEVLVIAEAA